MADPDPKNATPPAADAAKAAADAAAAKAADAAKASTAPARPKPGSEPYEVRAIAKGYFGGQIRVYGDKFTIAGDQDFASWMEPLKEQDRKRLADTVEKMQRGRKQPAAPGTKPTPATKLI